ncbi:MAG: hypothetical protein Q9174_005252, partial [Haloplaca sp. 1 TL-2023]
MSPDALAMLDTNLLQHLGLQQAEGRRQCPTTAYTDAFGQLPPNHRALTGPDDDWEDVAEDVDSADSGTANRHRIGPMAPQKSKKQPTSGARAFWPREKQKPNTNGPQRLCTASTAIGSSHERQPDPSAQESDAEKIRNNIVAGALLAELFSGDKAEDLNSVLATHPLLAQCLSGRSEIKDADTGPSLARSLAGGKDEETQQIGPLQLQTRPKQKV